MTAPIPPIAATGVGVSELPPAARFSLRLRVGDVAAASDALALPLPDRVGALAASGSRRALCLCPDEWLLEGPAGDAPALPAHLAHALVDIGDREIVFRLEGPQALELLSLGVARDLRRLAVGAGCRTAFDSAQVVLVREDEHVFTLSVWRSFAQHVAGLLAIGQREIASGF